MRIVSFLFFMAVVGLSSSCSHPSQFSDAVGGVTVIDVEAAMENLQDELKLSDFGKKVRYVPLEITDSCLVAGNPGVWLTDSCILVTTRQGFLPVIYSFDRATGRFITQIGHKGEDPTGFTFSDPFYNEDNGLLYFVRLPNQLQKYDSRGRYHGRAFVPVQPKIPVSFLFADSVVLGYHEVNRDRGVSNQRLLSVFNEDGALTDSVMRTYVWPLPGGKEDAGIFCAGHRKLSELAILEYTVFKNDQVNISTHGILDVWKCEGQIRVKDGFNDTLYTWKEGSGLISSYVFRYGKWQLDAKAWEEGDSRDKLLGFGVLETPDKLYFQCANHFFESLRESVKAGFAFVQKEVAEVKMVPFELYHGVYDKPTGRVRMAPLQAGITDDIAGFMPCQLNMSNRRGEFVGILEAHDVVAWLKEHPEAKDNPQLVPLLTVEEEDNPVVVIVSPGEGEND